MDLEISENKIPRRSLPIRTLLLPTIAMGGGFLLWNLFTAESSANLLWLLVLACPLMHFLMPHGHGGRAESGSSKKEQAGGEAPPMVRQSADQDE